MKLSTRKMRKQPKFRHVLVMMAMVIVVAILCGTIKEKMESYAKEINSVTLKQMEQLEVDFQNNKLTKEQMEQKLSLIRLEEQETQLKFDTLYVYFESLPIKGHRLIGTERDWVYYADKNGIDYKRAVAISVHETYYGTSMAINKQNNVAGINLTWEERKIMNVNGYTANLKTYQNLEESIMATCRKLKDYKEWYGAETLSQIKQKYCPDSDPRSSNNGGSYGDNTKWLTQTIKHYNDIEKIENRLREERGL